MKKIRLTFCGCGHRAFGIKNVVRVIPEFETIAVCDPYVDKAETMAESFGAGENNPLVYADHIKMFEELKPDAVQKRIEEIIEVLDMADFVDNRIERLSTGQTQRVSISRCLLHSPDTYIFDEPTLGLDILSSRSIIEFMKKEREAGKSVLYSTHYMEEAEFLCDRIIMVHKGKIIAQGTPAELRAQTGTTNLRETFLSLIEGKEDTDNEDK